VAQLETLLHAQFLAQARHYAVAFPCAEHSLVLVDHAPIGRWYVDRSSTAIRLVDVSLLRAHRGRGIGTELLEMLQAEATARQLPLRLNVLDGNPAYRLYRRLGFTERAMDGLHRQLEWLAAPRTTG
jgi:GNAT superfamily N-acetyltransferase